MGGPGGPLQGQGKTDKLTQHNITSWFNMFYGQQKLNTVTLYFANLTFNCRQINNQMNQD